MIPLVADNSSICLDVERFGGVLFPVIDFPLVQFNIIFFQLIFHRFAHAFLLVNSFVRLPVHMSNSGNDRRYKSKLQVVHELEMQVLDEVALDKRLIQLSPKPSV